MYSLLLVCVLPLQLHTRRGCIRHPAFPTHLFGARDKCKNIFEEDGLPGVGERERRPAMTTQLIIRRTPGLTFVHTNAISSPPSTASGLSALDGFGKMTGSTRSSGGLDDRRKRLLFRCWHRGTREMDLILGRFADAEIAALRDDELAQLEHLIEVPDPDLYAAVSGNRALAPEYASSLFDRIKSFRSTDRDA